VIDLCRRALTLSCRDWDGVAIAAFDRAIQLMPSLYQVWYARGIALSYNEEQEAIESFDRAIQGKEDFGPAWRWRGIVLSSVKQYEDALASLEKAISLDRKDSAAHFWRIVALKKLNRYKDGLDACNEAIESPLDSRIKYLFYNLCALTRIILGDAEGALADANKAIELNHNFAEAYFVRGVVHHRQGDYPAALSNLNQAISLNEKDGSFDRWFN